MKHTVIFVDDDPNLRESVKRSLKNEPYRILLVESAQECVDLLAVTDVQVVVSDLSMPGIDGNSLINYFKDTRPEIVRIVFSGNLNLKTVLDLINRGGVFRCLEKPCSTKHLIQAIEEAIKQSEMIALSKRLLSLVSSQCKKTGLSLKEFEDYYEVNNSSENCQEIDLTSLVHSANNQVEKLEKVFLEHEEGRPILVK